MQIPRAKSKIAPLATSRLAKTLAAEARKKPAAGDRIAQQEREVTRKWSDYLNGEQLLQKEERTGKLEPDEKKLVEDWLHTEEGFATNYLKLKSDIDNQLYPVDLETYQIDLLQNDGKFVFVKKSRRTGISWITSARGLIRAHLRDSYDSYYVSRNLEEAKEKIKYALELYNTMPLFIQKKLHGKSVKAQLEFEALDGTLSRLISHPQTEPRGREGDLYLDEFASYQRQQDVYKAAFACVLRKGTMWIVSTPRVKGDLFYSIDQASLKEFTAFKDGKYIIPWWECRVMLKPGMLEKARELAPTMPTQDRVYTFGSDRVISIYQAAASELDFKVEMECEYADDSLAFFDYDSVLRATYSGVDSSYASSIDWGEQSEHLSPIEQKMQRHSISRYFTRNPVEIVEYVKQSNSQNSFVIGLDPGFTDGFGIVVIEEVGHGMVVVRSVTKIRDGDYVAIERYVIDLVKQLRTRKVAVDIGGGEGRALCSRLSELFGPLAEDRVVEIKPDANKNMDMAMAMKRRFESGSIAIPYDDDLIRDIRKVKRVYSENTGMPLIEVKRDRKYGHGDLYFAMSYGVATIPDAEVATSEIKMPDYKKAGVPHRQFQGSPKITSELYRQLIRGELDMKKLRNQDFDDIRINSAFGMQGLPKP